MKRFSNNQGFTLVELMVAVAIVSIISGVAYSSYQDSIIRSRRADGQQALMQLENAIQRYFSEQSPYTFVGATVGVAGIFPNQAPIDGAVKNYNLQILNPTVSSYELRATPIAGSSQFANGLLEIRSTGVKVWDRDNDGDIGEASDLCWQKTC